MIRVVLAAASLVVSLTSCSVLTSFDGFGGGSSGEGGAHGDDAGDAAPRGGDAAGGTFCRSRASQSQSTFCADFDEGSLTTAWVNGVEQSQAVQSLNAVGLNTATFMSPPASLRAVTGGGPVFSDLEMDLTGGPYSTLHVELDVSPEDAKPTSVVEVGFCNGACNGDPAYHFFLLINETGSTCIAEHGNVCRIGLTQPGTPAIGAWSHVTLDAQMTDGAITATVGSVHIQGMLQPPVPLPSPGLKFAFGIPYVSTATVNVDNVLFSAH
jgi:hypothetical protein